MSKTSAGRGPLYALAAALLFAGSAGLILPPPTAVAQTSARPATVTVKFAEGSAIRLGNGVLTSAAGANTARLSAGLAALGVDLSAARPLFDRPASEIDRERAALQAETGESLPDLSLYYVLPVPAGTTADALARKLLALPGIDYAEPSPVPQPPPGDLPPKTPNFTARQGYRAAPPKGVGALNPGKVPGGTGARVTVADVEYSWQLNHEDLALPATANLDKAATADDPFDDVNHGTAVLGEIFGRKNAYGVTGLAPGVAMKVVPANTVQFGYNPARAIAVASGKLKRGDVIVIEQQYWACGSSSYGPLEVLQPVFDAVKIATAKGVIVVAAAGNGNINLDSTACGGLFDRKKRDSGAIIVGAGSSAGRVRMSFSSYGKRVDVQGWGENVWTTGYGDAFNQGARQTYTARFSGTSSATPIVAGVVAEIQGALKAKGRKPASPAEMRKALVATGTAQAKPATGHIGPLPNAAKALAFIIAARGG